MININTGQNVIDSAMAKIDRLIATGNKAREVETGSSPPRPPAYVKAKRAQSKCKTTGRQK